MFKYILLCLNNDILKNILILNSTLHELNAEVQLYCVMAPPLAHVCFAYLIHDTAGENLHVDAAATVW